MIFLSYVCSNGMLSILTSNVHELNWFRSALCGDPLIVWGGLYGVVILHQSSNLIFSLFKIMRLIDFLFPSGDISIKST